MWSKIWLMNIVLAVCIVFMGVNAWQVWTGEVPEQKVPAKTEVPAAVPAQKGAEKQKLPENEYSVIAEKNLFDPARKEAKPEEVTAAAPDEKKPDAPRQNIALYGVILMKDYQKALIRTAETDSGKDRWVKVGETVGTMTVSAIEKGRIVLTEGDEILEISLHEGKKRGAGSQSLAKNDAPNIINISASADEPPKASPAETPKPETKPADAKTDKPAAVQSNAPNPVFGGIDRQSGENKPAAAENNNADPVFGGGGGKISGGGNTQGNNNKGNAGENMTNPFLQLLQRKN
ncbi:MAG: type II secretion system protein N [Desulfococcaceae bacterium]